MNFTFRRWLCGFLILWLLVACSKHISPSADLGEMSRDDFMSAMRWKRYNIAASLMLQAHQQNFLKTFTALKDIHIIDVRMIDVKAVDANRRFDTTVEMDYYLLPSVTIKTFSFDQSWEFFSGDNPAQQGYLIVTPFPEFP